MSMFLVCFHQLMQLRGIFFVRKASLYMFVYILNILFNAVICQFWAI